ncbi:hypothetical protein BCR42DRAFT_451301 [Absidia repens]|uniref:Uncharacterized protein n=1 Tax=Absidia repens TaxID=90262 RepID=A0A1X2IH04_9FUNG|nr:hypothetical protein BCR42DRAFT_451301 [Absidia repens]
MNTSPIVFAMINYARVLHEAQSPQAADWPSHFVDRCGEWCLYLETELEALSEDLVDSYQNEAQRQLDRDYQLSLPPKHCLVDAWHHLYMTLISNKCISRDIYRYLLSTYTFMKGNKTARENLTMDLTNLAGMAATDNVLDEMEKLLAEEVNNNGDTRQGG